MKTEERPAAYELTEDGLGHPECYNNEKSAESEEDPPST